VGAFNKGVVRCYDVRSECRKIRNDAALAEAKFIKEGILEEGDQIIGIVEELGEGYDLKEIVQQMKKGQSEIEVSSEIYVTVGEAMRTLSQERKASVETKYKTVDKKVRPVALPLPDNAAELIAAARSEERLRDLTRIGHTFTDETKGLLKVNKTGFLNEAEEKHYTAMLLKNQKALAFNLEEIGCVDPKAVTPMVIFTVPHVPWNLKPLPIVGK
jgi:hypothetical protein